MPNIFFEEFEETQDRYRRQHEDIHREIAQRLANEIDRSILDRIIADGSFYPWKIWGSTQTKPTHTPKGNVICEGL